LRGNRKVHLDETADPADAGRDFLEAHGCAGAPCPRCIARGEPNLTDTPLIVKIVVGGRGTYLCLRCQPEPLGSLKRCATTSERAEAAGRGAI
jgi:formamidopyrimidine-DNA glycosylase